MAFISPEFINRWEWLGLYGAPTAFALAGAVITSATIDQWDSPGAAGRISARGTAMALIIGSSAGLVGHFGGRAVANWARKELGQEPVYSSVRADNFRALTQATHMRQ